MEKNTDKEINIRVLEENEYQEAMELGYRVFNEFEAVNYSKEGISEFAATITDKQFLSSLKIYGAFKKKDLLGLIATRDNGSHIALFFVEGKYHRQGIGRNLFEHMLDKTDAEKITVNSSVFARDIYRRFGFRQFEDEKEVNGLRFIPMVFYRKEFKK